MIGADGGVANTVVYLKNISQGKAMDLPEARQHLDQKTCRYVPHILLVAQGADLQVKSSDAVLHTVHMAVSYTHLDVYKRQSTDRLTMQAVATCRGGVRPMLTFTISKLRFVCVALAALFVGSAPCIFGQDLSVVSKEVQNLGRGPDNLKTVETLAKTPQLSTKLLIGELHTIRESRILNGEERPDAEHVLWCLRALRYVTGGKDFCAKTSHKFGNSEMCIRDSRVASG